MNGLIVKEVNMKNAPILLIVTYIGLFFFLSNAVEETVVEILEEIDN